MLTRRQLEVIDLIARGMTHEAAADALCIKFETARKHTNTARKRLGVHTNTHLCCVAVSAGWIDPVKAGVGR